MIDAAVEAGLRHLAEGRSVVLYSALGQAADRGGELDAASGGRHRLGRSLGRIQAGLLARAGLRRALIAGADTSSHALERMGIATLTLRVSLPQTPGSSLCVALGARATGWK